MLYEDSNVEVVYVPSQGGASTGSNLHPFRVHLENTVKSKRQEKNFRNLIEFLFPEKASFVLASDNRLRNVRLAWTSEFPLVHVLGKERPARDLQEGFTTALTRLLVEENLSSDRRLVVLVSAGSYSIIKGCHDPDSILGELWDLRVAIERVLPPGAITVVSTLPCTSGKGLTKKAQARASEMFTQVNQLMTDYYRQQIPAQAVKVVSAFGTKRVSIVLTKAEVSKLTLPLETCFKYFSEPALCCFCLVKSSKLSTSYTKGSFCMACDRCLFALSAPELAVGKQRILICYIFVYYIFHILYSCLLSYYHYHFPSMDSDCPAAKDGEQLQVPSQPEHEEHEGHEEEDLGWQKIFQMKACLKKKEPFTMVSLADALAGLLAVAYDKDLFALLKKVLKEEATGVGVLSSCTYNDVAFLGITGERAVNLNLNRHVPVDQGEVLVSAAVVIRDCLQALVSQG